MGVGKGLKYVIIEQLLLHNNFENESLGGSINISPGAVKPIMSL